MKPQPVFLQNHRYTGILGSVFLHLTLLQFCLWGQVGVFAIGPKVSRLAFYLFNRGYNNLFVQTPSDRPLSQDTLLHHAHHTVTRRLAPPIHTLLTSSERARHSYHYQPRHVITLSRHRTREFRGVQSLVPCHFRRQICISKPHLRDPQALGPSSVTAFSPFKRK